MFGGAQLAYAFSGADCACATDDINLQVKLSTGLPSGTTGSVEVWVGTGCDSYATRTATGQTACEKVATLDIAQLTTSSTAGADGILVPIPSLALFSPVVHQCPVAATMVNQVYLLAFQNPAQNLATCTMSLYETTAPPPAALSPSATRSADGTVTVRWTGPDVSSAYDPLGYQLLCADLNGRPLGTNAAPPSYSV